MNFVGTVAAAVLILPPLMLMVITSTDIGERILTHLYVDDSAAVRNVQWLVLDHLNLHDVLFGVTPERLGALKYQIGLGEDTTDIENFWLLMFLNLGIIGFIVFLVALILYLVHLGRTVEHPLGWMLLVSMVLIASTSNSLGRKSTDLFFTTAFMIAMTGFKSAVPVEAASFRRKALTSLRRTTERLGAKPSSMRPTHLAGLKS
jgi:hypothetical protein